VYFTAGIDDKLTQYTNPYTYSVKIWNPEVELITRNHCIIHQTHYHIGCLVLSKLFRKNKEN